MTLSTEAAFEADRPFQLWFYTVSHSCLLLRATPRAEGESRIDMLFTPVNYIEMPHLVPSLAVHESWPEDWPAGHAATRQETVGSGKIYRLSWRGGSGCIIAGVLAWHEDDGDYSTPSHFEGRAWLPGRGP